MSLTFSGLLGPDNVHRLVPFDVVCTSEIRDVAGDGQIPAAVDVNASRTFIAELCERQSEWQFKREPEVVDDEPQLCPVIGSGTSWRSLKGMFVQTFP